MFEQAARMKLRFLYKGQTTVEDLWDLRVDALDGIYKQLRVQQKEASGESLLTPATTNSTLDLRVEIVKRIVSVKLAENQARLEKAKRRARRDRIAEIYVQKADEELKGKTKDELRQLLAEMEAEDDKAVTSVGG